MHYICLWYLLMSGVVYKPEVPYRLKRQKIQVEIRHSWSWNLITFPQSKPSGKKPRTEGDIPFSILKRRIDKRIREKHQVYQLSDAWSLPTEAATSIFLWQNPKVVGVFIYISVCVCVCVCVLFWFLLPDNELLFSYLTLKPITR